MRYKKVLFLSMMFALCTAEGCPSRCEKQSDCDTPDEYCGEGTDDTGQRAKWCFPNHPTAEQVRTGRAAGWSVKKVTVGIPSGVSAEFEKE